MAHNISKRQALSRARAISLGHFKGESSVLSVNCAACQQTREIPLSLLREQYGADLLLGTVVFRLRCRHCRDPAFSVKLKKPGGEYGITLKGPGAY